MCKIFALTLIAVCMVSMCLADLPGMSPDIMEKFNSIKEKMCGPNKLTAAQIQGISLCHIESYKVDPGSVKACNTQLYGKKSLDERKQELCNMDPDIMKSRSKAVSISNVFCIVLCKIP